MDGALKTEGPPLPAAAHIFYNTEQAAAYAGVSPRMIRRAREKGQLATTRLGGTRAFHTPQQIDEWIAACTTPAAPRRRSEAV